MSKTALPWDRCPVASLHLWPVKPTRSGGNPKIAVKQVCLIPEFHGWRHRVLTTPLIDKAFDSLMGNLPAALRTSLVPFGLAVMAALSLNFPAIMILLQDGTGLGIKQIHMTLLFLSMFPFLYASFFIAVRWHQFSLGTQHKGGFGRPVAYGLVSLLISILTICLTLFLSLIISIVTGQGASVSVQIGDFSQAFQKDWGAVILNAFGSFLFSYVFLRWSPWLVSFAMNETVGNPFHRTLPMRKEIAQIAAIYTLATLIWAGFGMLPLPGLLVALVSIILLWIAFMMSIAILSEIYRATCIAPTGSAGQSLQDPGP